MTKAPEKKNLKEDAPATPAADSLKTTPITSRSDLLSMIMSRLSGATPEVINKFYETINQQAPGDYSAETGGAGNVIPDGAAKQNAGTIEAKPSYASAAQEDLKAVFDGQTLSEEIFGKVSTLFEAAVSARVVLEQARIEEEYSKKLEEAKVELKKSVDEYLDYAAGEWMKENEVAVESSIRVELANDLVEDLKQVLARHNVDIAEDKIDAAAALTEKVEELEEKLNQAINDNIELEKEVLKGTARAVFKESAEGLTVAQVEKFKSLAESIEFEGDVEDLKKKLGIIREANFKAGTPVNEGAKTEPKKKVLMEGEVVSVKTEVDGEVGDVAVQPSPEMRAYVEAMKRLMPFGG